MVRKLREICCCLHHPFVTGSSRAAFHTTELSSVSAARADSCVALNAAPLTLTNTTALWHCLRLLDKQIHLVLVGLAQHCW